MHGSQSVLPLASVLPTVLFVGMMMAGILGVMSLVSRKDVYDDIERGDGPPVDGEQTPPAARTADESAEASAAGDAAGERAERELEIRQMLEARSARRVRNGGEPLDVEGEVARLLGESGDQAQPAQLPTGSECGEDRAEIELEVRQMLEARSARRVRNGGEPLDVEAEVARLLSDTDDPV